MKFSVITLFPALVEEYCRHGLLGAAKTDSRIQISVINPRQFTSDVHQTVDDRAFGGGDGMVMKPEPLSAAIQNARSTGPAHVVVLSPQGKPWNQAKAMQWSKEGGHYVLVCGRYAGIDHRLVVKEADEEISIGDFVLNGGELAALAIIESVTRLRPGVLGNAVSAEKDSFTEGVLECPQFTRPREWEGMNVPEPLLSGHHARIEAFVRGVSHLTTALRRPDLKVDMAAIRAVIPELMALSENELRALGLSREDLQKVNVR